MSLNKAIEHNKEKRKPYTKAKAVDKYCRNHGLCVWCKDNRTRKELEKDKNAEKEIKKWN